MLRGLIKRRLAAFERAYDYDTSYTRDILDASLTAFWRFLPIEKMARFRKDVPLDAWYAAKIAAALSEDCGPCTQLVVDMAEKAGVAPGVLRGILAGDEAAMGPDATLGLRFARAVLAHDPEADVLREELLKRWGKRGLVSLALTMAASRVFPSVKYALGHGKACVRVRVAGVEAVPRIAGGAA
jgi:hypothetical protein